jgi:hypothetical protein
MLLMSLHARPRKETSVKDTGRKHELDRMPLLELPRLTTQLTEYFPATHAYKLAIKLAG